MANELQAHGLGTGKTLYCPLVNAVGRYYNGATFGAFSAADWADYAIALTEIGAGSYMATMPAVAAGQYSYAVYEQAGASPAVTDTFRGLGSLDWTGTGVAVPPSASGATYDDLLDELDVISAKTNLIGGSGSMSVITPVVGGVLTFTIGASFPATPITGLTIDADWTKYKFTLKRNADDPDSAALLQYVVSNPPAGTTDGVLYVEGAAATVAQRTLASLVVTQAAGTIALPASALLTTALSPHASLVWDLKEFTATDETIRATGTALALHAVTWTTT
jgi:hypothetical protein